MLKLTSIVTALFCFTLGQTVFASETSSTPTAGAPACPHMKQAGIECPHIKAGGTPADCPHMKKGDCPHQKGDCACKGDTAKPCPCAGTTADKGKPADKPTNEKTAKKSPTTAGKKPGKKTK